MISPSVGKANIMWRAQLLACLAALFSSIAWIGEAAAYQYGDFVSTSRRGQFQGVSAECKKKKILAFFLRKQPSRPRY